MVEESEVFRLTQKLAALGLLVFAVPMLFFSLYGLVKVIYFGIQNKSDPFVFIFIGLISAFLNIMGYRLFTGRGVRHGGGVLSPLSYYILGCFFAIVGLFFGYIFISELGYNIIVGIICTLILSYWCFVAARNRGEMRNIPK